MLGPLARGSAPLKRRARRRIVVVVISALVLALLVGEVVDQVVKASTPAARRSTSSWVAAVAPIVGESSGLSSTLREVRNLGGLPACTSGGCQRTVLDAMLGQLVTGSASDVVQLDDIGLIPPSQRSGSLLEGVLSGRAQASKTLAGAVALLLGPSRGHATLARAQGLLLSVGSELTAADADYRELVRSLAHVAAPKLGQSVWVSSAKSWTRGGVQGWANRLVAATGLQSLASIAILAVSTNPPVLRIQGLPASTTTTATTTTTSSTTTTTTSTIPGKRTTTTTTTTTTSTVPPTTTTLQVPPPGSLSVLAPTSKLAVQVVVANAGNVGASPVTVVAALRARSGAAQAVGTSTSVTDRVRSLAPGVARYLSMPAMVVHKGETYTLTVSATVPGWRVAVERVVVHVAT
ncbi:MAG: hypothetical protein JWO62_712 [Acidimicrobiaceae bacterium]|nr:hypothetical protein [Acidimicrobiaceae bacterium]